MTCFGFIRRQKLIIQNNRKQEKIMADMQNAYVKLDKVSKIYQMGEVEIKAVDEKINKK